MLRKLQGGSIILLPCHEEPRLSTSTSDPVVAAMICCLVGLKILVMERKSGGDGTFLVAGVEFRARCLL